MLVGGKESIGPFRGPDFKNLPLTPSNLLLCIHQKDLVMNESGWSSPKGSDLYL